MPRRKRRKRLPPLPAPPAEPGKPNPQPWDDGRHELLLSLDEVEGLKRYNCVSYEGCVDSALRLRWEQFHCNSCRCYVRIVEHATDVPMSDPDYSLVTPR